MRFRAQGMPPSSIAAARCKANTTTAAALKRIRFIDRFEVIDGKITKQDVWNDMAEVRANT